MKTIRKIGEHRCKWCGALSNTKIEFENTTMLLCNTCEEKFKEEIKEEHL